MASYRKAVQWIADNDEPGELDPREVASMISTELVGYIFDKRNIEVAQAIVRHRKKNN